MKKILTENLQWKILSIFIAIVMFTFVRTDKNATTGIAVDVLITHPNHMEIVSDPIKKVRVTLSGKLSSLKKILTEDLPPITLDLKESGIYTFSENDLKLPTAIRVKSIQPASFIVKFESKIQKTIKIVPEVFGRLKDGYAIKDNEILIEPSEVGIEGLKARVDPLNSVKTEKIILTGKDRTFIKKMGLQKYEGITYPKLDTVTVTVIVVEKAKELILKKVPLSIANLAVDYLDDPPFTPRTFDLKIKGPRSVIEKLEQKKVTGVLDLTEACRKGAGEHKVYIKLAEISDELEFLEISPDRVLVTLYKKK